MSIQDQVYNYILKYYPRGSDMFTITRKIIGSTYYYEEQVDSAIRRLIRINKLRFNANTMLVYPTAPSQSFLDLA